MFGEGRGALNGRGRPERLPVRPARGKGSSGQKLPEGSRRVSPENFRRERLRLVSPEALETQNKRNNVT